jgi:hypothetical protein
MAATPENEVNIEQRQITQRVNDAQALPRVLPNPAIERRYLMSLRARRVEALDAANFTARRLSDAGIDSVSG